MKKFKALIKGEKKAQFVTFIDWDTTFIKVKDGRLTDFKHCTILEKRNGEWVPID
jgi:hypothetical protein